MLNVNKDQLNNLTKHSSKIFIKQSTHLRLVQLLFKSHANKYTSGNFKGKAYDLDV